MIDQQTNFGFEESMEMTKLQAERDRIREEYRARLAEKLKDPEFRKIEGFPLGTDEAILALSDPPYYTACPNPFLEEWLAANAKPYDPATDNYHREPFAADVSEGKNDPIYNAHSYHTKVPHKAIMRYILHYTQPGDVVYDGFCGTGMTGVAAQMCGDKAQVESLGYIVDSEGNIWEPEAWKTGSKQESRKAGNQEKEEEKSEKEKERTNGSGAVVASSPAFLSSWVPAENIGPFSKLGARKAILNDLSPAATFIAYNYNTPVDAVAFEREAKRILKEVEDECGWMYETEDKNGQKGRINFTIWGEQFLCPSCSKQFNFAQEALDTTSKRVKETVVCPNCRSEYTKSALEHAFITLRDDYTNVTRRKISFGPIRVNYTINGKVSEKPIDPCDLNLLARIDQQGIVNDIPTKRFPIEQMSHGSRLAPKGFEYVHDLYTPRALRVLSVLWKKANAVADERLRRFMLFTVEQTVWGLSLMARYAPTHFSQVNQYLSGVYYVASMVAEVSPWYILDGKIKRLVQAFKTAHTVTGNVLVVTGSCDATNVPENSIDYLFTDPPFGENIYYADLNFLIESWHRVITQAVPEAIIDQAKKKRLVDYQDRMTACFAQYYRSLKPGRWMTVEFHNSANSVWNAIQEGLQKVGFVVADVRALNKEQASYRQITAVSAVKQDLIISCYKPRHEFEERFKQVQGKPEGVVEFLREHLAMLPVAPVNKAGRLEATAERTRFLLFDRMVAYHLQRGARIPLSASEFYKLLEDQFIERDEMYFLNEQAARYDALKARGVETEQLSIFVRDEKTAVQWVRSRLSEQPQTLGDLTPKFMQELREWDSHEPRPELRDLLKEYFVESGGEWRVPDPTSERDIESMRRNALLRLFREYTSAKGPLKVFRKEAVLEGFRHCWETQQYGVIIAVCEKIPEKILQEIQDFVMMYDVAKDLAPTQQPQTAFVWE